MRTDQFTKLESLLVRYFEGILQQDEIHLLEECLKDNPEAQDYYFDYLKTFLALKQVRSFSLNGAQDRSDFQQMLEELGKYEKDAAVVEVETPEPTTVQIENVQHSRTAYRVSKLALYTAIVSAAALLFLVLLVKFAPPKEGDTVAFLERAIYAKWDNVSGKITEGSQLSAGPMKLVSGCVEMTMRNGASVIMQAPVEFTLESAGQIFLQSGRLTATLKSKPGDTFVVRSPFGSIVDYGTEFGVYVGSGGAAETYVFRGKVQLRDSADPLKFTNSVFISEGQGGVAELSGGILEIRSGKVDSRQFVRSEEMLLRDQAAQGSSYHRWLAYKYEIQRDPSLVACWRFERDALHPEELINGAPLTGSALNGLLGDREHPQSSPTWTEGRWPQTTALQFDRALEQFVRVPDNPRLRMAGPITVAAWVKLPSADDSQGGMILSNRTLDDINYQLVLGKRPSIDKMVLAFGRYGMHLDPKVHSEFLELTGQEWHHIAVTHDNHTVQYYIDGKLVSAIPYVFEQQPVAADLYIGFTPVAQSAGFHGVLGELLLFDRAMSEQEVMNMYLQTRP